MIIGKYILSARSHDSAAALLSICIILFLVSVTSACESYDVTPSYKIVYPPFGDMFQLFTGVDFEYGERVQVLGENRGISDPLWIVGIIAQPELGTFGVINIEMNRSGEFTSLVEYPHQCLCVGASGRYFIRPTYFTTPIKIYDYDEITMRVKDSDIAVTEHMATILYATGFEPLSYNLSDITAGCPVMPEDWTTSGEGYIYWTWNFTNAVVWLDGEVVDVDNDVQYYLLSGLRSTETHRLDVLDTGNDTIWYSIEQSHQSFVYDVVLVFLVLVMCILPVGGSLKIVAPVLGLLPATALLLVSIEDGKDGWLILFAGFLIVVCLLVAAWKGSVLIREKGK